MKLLITTIAAVVLVGCGPSEADRVADRTLIDAAYAGNVEAVKQHLAAGTDVNAKGKYGRAPLHYAAKYGRKETVELLIAKGADLNAKDDDGKTPLDRAIKYNRTEFAALLRKHGGKTSEELKTEGISE